MTKLPLGAHLPPYQHPPSCVSKHNLLEHCQTFQTTGKDSGRTYFGCQPISGDLNPVVVVHAFNDRQVDQLYCAPAKASKSAVIFDVRNAKIVPPKAVQFLALSVVHAVMPTGKRVGHRSGSLQEMRGDGRSATVQPPPEVAIVAAIYVVPGSGRECLISGCCQAVHALPQSVP